MMMVVVVSGKELVRTMEGVNEQDGTGGGCGVEYGGNEWEGIIGCCFVVF